MRFVFVNATKIWSGVKTWILTLGQALAHRGHEVLVVAYPGLFIDVCRQQGLEALPLRFGFDGNPWVVARLAFWFATRQADWVITNIDKDIYVAGLAARCVGARVANHVGRPNEVHLTGFKAFFRAQLIELFIVPSVWTADSAQGHAPWLRQHRLEVLYNPIDTVRFSPRQAPGARPSSRLRIGITGRLSPLKGQHTLIQALALLPPDIRARVQLEIAGEGPEEMALRTLTHTAGVADRVRFVGFVTDPERFLQELDIAAFPSLSESFCLAAAEAMSCGLPVVASAVDGLAEIIQDGKSGLLVPPNDPAALAAALARLCRDAALRQTLGRTARREVETRFAVERIAARFEALCRAPP